VTSMKLLMGRKSGEGVQDREVLCKLSSIHWSVIYLIWAFVDQGTHGAIAEKGRLSLKSVLIKEWPIWIGDPYSLRSWCWWKLLSPRITSHYF
jgi:hypothetical protein